jgi:hypothetical protein
MNVREARRGNDNQRTLAQLERILATQNPPQAGMV